MITETCCVKKEKAKELFDLANSAVWYLKEKQKECEKKEQELNLPVFLAVQRDWDITKAQRVLLNGIKKIVLGGLFSIKEANQFAHTLEIYNAEDFFEEAR